jgi:hypothetical protein
VFAEVPPAIASPADGRMTALRTRCSACCVLVFAVLAGLPADIEERRQEGEAA